MKVWSSSSVVDMGWRLLQIINVAMVAVGLSGAWDRTEVRWASGEWRTVRYIFAEYVRNVDQGRVVLMTMAVITLTLGVLATRHRSWAGFLQATALLLVVAVFAIDPYLHEPIIGEDGWTGYTFGDGRFASTSGGFETNPEFGYDEWRRTFYWQPLAMLVLSSVGVVTGWLCAVLGVVGRRQRLPYTRDSGAFERGPPLPP